MSQPLSTDSPGTHRLEPDYAAGFLGASDVAQLWQQATRAQAPAEGATAESARLLHIPSQHVFHTVGENRHHTIVGTWTLRGILDCMRSVALEPSVLGEIDASAICHPGLESHFPSLLPDTIHLGGAGRIAYRPAPDDPALGDDDAYFEALAQYWSLRAVSPASDQRDRTNALSAAAFATAGRSIKARDAFSHLSAYEIETRARHIGMVAGDLFMRTLAWTAILTGPKPMRAFNAIVAWWATATLMPRPFRLGLLTRCLGNPSLTVCLLAADAAYPRLRAAAAQRALNTATLPTDGVKYAPAATGFIPHGIPVRDIAGLLHGIPVFVPPPGPTGGNWSLLIPVRLPESTAPKLLPGLPALRRAPGESAADIALIHIGDGRERGDAEVTVSFLDSRTSVKTDEEAAGPEEARVLRWLGALCSAHKL